MASPIRARLWLLLADLFERIDRFESIDLEPLWRWAILRAAAATDWGPGAKRGDEEPW